MAMPGHGARQLSIEELAGRTSESTDDLRRWHSLGLIGHGAGGFGPADVERVRLIGLFLRRGIGLEAIASADREQRLVQQYLDTVFPDGVPPSCSLAEAAELVGLPTQLVQRVWWAAGLGAQGEAVREDDVQMLRGLKLAIDSGFTEEAAIQIVRVCADALGRVAEAEARLFHLHVHARLARAGLSGPPLVEATRAAQERLTPLIEPTILYFHRKGVAQAARDDAVLHLAEEAGLPPTGDVTGQLPMAVVFVDLSSFTPLTVAMGDLAAAGVLHRFSDLVREAIGPWAGRVVKQIGDAFMLVFPDPRSAIAAALEIERRAADEDQFPAVRSGVHWGRVLYREGDYVGSVVNTAARLAAEAERHQVLATAAVRDESSGLTDAQFVPLGKRSLKGLVEPLELFEVRRSDGARGKEKVVDPVCGMELEGTEVAARLSLGGRDWTFCSQACLRQFMAAPERYSG
jgi:adenylate cyclase